VRKLRIDQQRGRADDRGLSGRRARFAKSGERRRCGWAQARMVRGKYGYSVAYGHTDADDRMRKTDVVDSWASEWLRFQVVIAQRVLPSLLTDM